MKFREEYKLIFPHNPDIIVVQECENLNTINFDLFSNIPSDFYWIGENPKKGLGVIAFNDFKISLCKDYNSNFKYVLPLIIKRNNSIFHLIGVWTQKVGEKKKDHINYIRQFKLSLNEYDDFLNVSNVIICGDFNSNLLWKKKRGIVTDHDHKYVVEELENKGIKSSYHYFFDEKQGKETRATYYHQHKKEKPFHIDFCFLSNGLIDNMVEVKIGEYKDWIKYSDHMPMSVVVNHND